MFAFIWFFVFCFCSLRFLSLFVFIFIFFLNAIFVFLRLGVLHLCFFVDAKCPTRNVVSRHAITLAKLAHYQKEDRQAEIREHLQKATQIDAADPHAWHLLGNLITALVFI